MPPWVQVSPSERPMLRSRGVSGVSWRTMGAADLQTAGSAQPSNSQLCVLIILPAAVPMQRLTHLQEPRSMKCQVVEAFRKETAGL